MCTADDAKLPVSSESRPEPQVEGSCQRCARSGVPEVRLLPDTGQMAARPASGEIKACLKADDCRKYWRSCCPSLAVQQMAGDFTCTFAC